MFSIFHGKVLEVKKCADKIDVVLPAFNPVLGGRGRGIQPGYRARPRTARVNRNYTFEGG